MRMDKVFIEGLEIEALIGIYDQNGASGRRWCSTWVAFDNRNFKQR